MTVDASLYDLVEEIRITKSKRDKDDVLGEKAMTSISIRTSKRYKV